MDIEPVKPNPEKISVALERLIQDISQDGFTFEPWQIATYGRKYCSFATLSIASTHLKNIDSSLVHLVRPATQLTFYTGTEMQYLKLKKNRERTGGRNMLLCKPLLRFPMPKYSRENSNQVDCGSP